MGIVLRQNSSLPAISKCIRQLPYDMLCKSKTTDMISTLYSVCSFQCRGFRIGIIICADMRNPSLNRLLASKAHNCDVILRPAASSRDISLRTRKSFRETRAVENSVYFVGINYAGDNFGNTAFVEPWVDENNEPDVPGTDEGAIINGVKRDVLDRIQREFPYYGQVMRKDWHEFRSKSAV